MVTANHISDICDDRRVKRVWPEPEIELAATELAASYPWPPSRGRAWIRANMVMSIDGSCTGPDGLSKSISSPADRTLLGLLRRHADVILVGANTIRSENYGPPTKPLAIVSNSLELPAELAMFNNTKANTPKSMVLTSQSAIDTAPTDLRERIDLIACGADGVDLKLAVAALTDLGLTRIHCEGGPKLLGSLIAAALLDELLLTISPVLVGGTDHLIAAPALPALSAKPVH
ncbi:MAG: dihydrofolate reductase family protein, partial [Actinomycetota bacterium]|nr:dihydrofolate reductase family protein [Actinomycetota bacterium]